MVLCTQASAKLLVDMWGLWNTSGLPGIRAVPCALATLSDPGGTCAFLHNVCALLPAVAKNTSASALYKWRGSITSRFRIAALALLCLRLNLASRLRLQGWVPAACLALLGWVFHPTILHAPNRRTHAHILPHLPLFSIFSVRYCPKFWPNITLVKKDRLRKTPGNPKIQCSCLE